MFYRQENNWELWPNAHPSRAQCDHGEGGACLCRYHVINAERTEMYGFDAYDKAEKKFCELSGGMPFIVGKTRFENGVVVSN